MWRYVVMKVNCCKCGKIMDSDEMFCGECGCKYFIIDTETYEAEKCPLILIEHKLFELDGNVKLESLFLNESDKTIAACKVVIKCFDQFGDAVEDTTAKYMDLSIGTYETFGETKIIDLKSNETRKVELKVDKIIFDDGTSWECNDDLKFILANKNKYEKFINKLENQRMQIEEKNNNSKKYYDLLALKNKWVEILYKIENEIGVYSGNEDCEDNVLECLRSSNDGVGLVEQYFNELTTILGGDLNIFIPEEINSLETDLFDLYFESDNETCFDWLSEKEEKKIMSI